MFRITKKGQVTIPKRMREALGLKEGDVVAFIYKDGEVLIRKESRKSILSLGGRVGSRSGGDMDDEGAADA